MENTFNEVLSHFTASLTDDQKEDFKLTTLDDLQNTVLDIQERKAASKTMRYVARMRPFLEAMDQYGKVVEVFLNASQFLAYIWGPAKFILQVASSFTEAFDALLDVYREIGESIPLLSQYETLFSRNPFMRKVLERIYIDILSFHQKALKYFRGKVWKQLFSAIWKTFRSDFSEILGNLQRHRRLVESQANIVEFEQLFNELEKARIAAEKQHQLQNENEQRHRRAMVRSWLSAASFEHDQERGLEVRKDCPPSGTWLLKEISMKKWLDPSFPAQPSLWLTGIPGSGKTVLASVVIEALQKQSQSNGASIAYFYCKYQDPSRNTFDAVSRGILAQLLQQNEELLLPFVYECAAKSGENCLRSPTLAKEVLETVLISSEPVWIILDGLDECDLKETKKITTWFQNLADLDPVFQRCRCLYISQDNGETRKLLPKIPKVQIQAQKSGPDILQFSEHLCRDIQSKFGLADEKRDWISKKVTDTANGMFLYAKLVLENLYNQTKRINLHRELEAERFPKGLEDAYNRILDRIMQNPTISEDTQTVLGWLACAKRPLKWYEIQGATSIDLAEQSVNFEERKFRLTSKELCGSLVEESSDGTVQFAHLTARLFLINRNYVDLVRQERFLAKLCMAYLLLPGFKIPTNSDIDPKRFAIEGYYSFTNYASIHWADHLGSWAKETSDAELESLAKELLPKFLCRYWPVPTTLDQENKRPSSFSKIFKGYEFWQQLDIATSNWNSLRGTRGFSAPQQTTDLLLETVLATRLFVEEASFSTTNSSSSVSEMITYYGTKIYKCTKPSCEYFSEGLPTKRERDEHVDKHERAFFCTALGCPYQLLGFDTGVNLSMHSARVHGERDAKITDAESFPVTMETVKIDEAIEKDSLPEVKLWLQKEMKLQGKSLGELSFAKLIESLEQAIRLGRMVIFEHLLDATRCDNRHIAMLFSRACKFSDDQIAFFLLNHSEADPYGAKHPDSMALLCDALSNRRYEVVQFMLRDHTAIPNEKFPARSFSDAISAAVQSGDASLLKMLMARHTTIMGNTFVVPSGALCAATASGNEEMTELLLDFPGCDINSKSGGETALHCAVLCRMPNIIRMLLTTGKCDLHVKDYYGRTVLALASKASTADIVRIILDSAEARLIVNLGDNDGYTPLHHAACRGDKVITKLLLDVGQADLNAVTFSGSTPMELAAMSKQRSIIEMLMQSPNCQEDSLKWMDVAQLFLDIENRNITAVKQVLERGRIPHNVMTLNGLTPLMLAVELHSPDLITYLLSKAGLNPNLRKDHDPNGLTALHMAIQSRRIGVLNAFLEDISAVDFSLKVYYQGKTMDTLEFARAVFPSKRAQQSLQEALERRDFRN